MGEAGPTLTISSWRTRNYVGTIFGGSMYSAVDPIYMVRRLGKDYGNRLRSRGKTYLHPQAVARCETLRRH